MSDRQTVIQGAGMSAQSWYGSSPACSQYFWYWIYWQDGLLQWGNGNVTGQNLILTYYDTSPSPTAVNRVMLTGQSTGGSFWVFPEQLWEQGRQLYCTDLNAVRLRLI